ncbi:hypothetical protein BDV34DRAFT_16459 [Aspergillus parasiticus]|uniref:Uncharacterized protein n=1 Tax=Aspergillus parasiticus TaxID=5067 RepID=A0A5N6DW95_ASPPA|nr:hypothetical protein BDV34DRAFT_16459 [Aspergillus parasiticus]
MTPHWRWEAQKRSTFLSPTGLLVVRALFPYWAVETYVCRKCRRFKLLSQLSEEEILCLVNEAPCYIFPFFACLIIRLFSLYDSFLFVDQRAGQAPCISDMANAKLGTG